MVEHLARCNTISVSISAQRPGTGITLQLSALRVMCESKIGKVWCFSETEVVVSERFSAPGMHFELQRNIDFCDTNFEISTSWTDPLVQPNGFVTNSFCDLTPPNESHGRKTRTQNPFSRNEFTDSEQFVVEHPARPKTSLPSMSVQRRY